MRFAFIALSMAIFAYSAMATSNDYYASAQGKTGDELRRSLYDLVKANHRITFKNSDLKHELTRTDVDHHNPDNLITFYTQQSIEMKKRDPGKGKELGYWNNEHIWPSSHGFQEESFEAYTDLHHVRAAERQVNGFKSDCDLGEVNRPSEQLMGAKKQCFGNCNDKCVFEPPDKAKGDTARALFYIAIRYEGVDNETTPDLRLLNELTESRKPVLGDLCTLLRWNSIDQPEEIEMQRHKRIVERQGNRNPFIDHPEFANAIWGEQCN